MNERIKELAEQAGCTIDGMGYGEGNVEKFAELIVRECVEVCNSCSPWAGPDGISKEIKEHFGVEE